jgi:hypothetical protein
MQAGFDVLAAHIATLSAQGTIVVVDAAWTQFGCMRGAQPAIWGGRAQLP